jgi:hypothetical protein
MSEQPLALQWLCFIRDHGVDLKVTLGERALASLLPTYGQGKNIYVTMKSLARVTGWSRNTVTKHRDGLIAKGLLEDITGDPDKQVRTYRLTVPGYVEGAQILSTPAQILSTPAQILSTPCSESEHNIKPSDLAGESSNTSPSPSAPDDDGDGASLEGQSQSQNQAPAGPGLIDWTGNPDENGHTSRDWLASWLEVPAVSIGAPLWRWLEGLGLKDEGPDVDALLDAAKRAAGKPSQVGYFQSILPGKVSQFHADAEKEAAEERAEREAATAEEERQRQIRAERDAILAECEKLFPHYAAQWYTSEPAAAHANADREVKARKPVARLEHMRQVIARSEEHMAEDPEYAAEARPQIARFLEQYAEWSAGRAA